jgi:cytochrome c oxidase cbb3-type subunit 4
VDVNTLRIATTVLSFVAFIGLVAWAWSRRNQPGFAEAAQLPFADSSAPAGATNAAKDPGHE